MACFLYKVSCLSLSSAHAIFLEHVLMSGFHNAAPACRRFFFFTLLKRAKDVVMQLVCSNREDTNLGGGAASLLIFHVCLTLAYCSYSVTLLFGRLNSQGS